MFFPFDLYLLRQSHRFIRPYFIHWSMVEPPNTQEEFSEADDNFVNATFLEPSSSWEDDSLQDMDFAASLMRGLGHAFNEEEDLDVEEAYIKRQGGTEIITTRGFEVGSFNSNDAFIVFLGPHVLHSAPGNAYSTTRLAKDAGETSSSAPPISFYVRDFNQDKLCMIGTCRNPKKQFFTQRGMHTIHFEMGPIVTHLSLGSQLSF